MKKITIKHEGKSIGLSYTRKSAKIMEQNGFMFEQVFDKPNTYVPMLFQGSFLAEASYMSPKIIDEIWENLPNKEELIGKLMEMYADTLNDLLSTTGDEKNSTWEASW